MNSSRLLAAALAVALAGCGGSDTTAPPVPTVSSVTVTPGAHTLEATGASVQFLAVAKNTSGGTVSGQPVAWASSNVSVATVSATGLATAVAPGNAAITATVGGVAGSAVLTVSELSAACASPKTVSLATGGSQRYAGSDCLILPSGLSGDRYRVAVLRPAETGIESDVITTTLKVVGLGVSQAPAPVSAPSLVTTPLLDIPGLSQAAVRKAMRVAQATEQFHMWMRDQDAALAREAHYRLLPPRVDHALTRVVAKASSPAKMTFETTAGSTCTPVAGNSKTGLLIAENDDLAIYQDSTQNATKPVSVGLAQQMTTFYSAYIRAMIPQYWGDVSDIDGNGKIILFATPRVTGDVAAFVWSGDFYPTSECAGSNEKELMYFNTELILDMEGAEPTYQALETMAHETKHVVSLYNRIAASRRMGSDQFHPGWVEEGRAEVSGEMASRLAWKAQGGPALNEPISRASFQAADGITPENYGVAIHLARVVWYLSSQPNGLVVTPTGATEGSSVYGSGWLFHRWLGDAYGGAASAPMADAPMFKALNDSTAAKGVQGITNSAGKPFLDLFYEFVTAISLHETTAPQPAKRFTTYDFASSTGIFCNPNPLGVFPWPVTSTGTLGDCDAEPRVTESSTPSASFKTANYAGSIGASGMRIHDFLSNGTGTGAQMTLDSGGQPATILVVRIR